MAITVLFLYTRNRLLAASYPGSSNPQGVLGITVDLLFLGVVADWFLLAALATALAAGVAAAW